MRMTNQMRLETKSWTAAPKPEEVRRVSAGMDRYLIDIMIVIWRALTCTTTYGFRKSISMVQIYLV